MSAEELVRELAAMTSFEVSAPDGWQVDCWCMFCESKETHPKQAQQKIEQHKPTCLWRRAKEWVAANE